jgi:transcriptional/translational regulatory protein YebC/TACO1
MEIALEAGAEDVREDKDGFEIITAPADFELVRQALEDAAIPFSNAEVTLLPQTTLNLEGKEAEQMIRLMDTLEDCDDVQKVHTNADISDEVMSRL